MQQLYLHPDLFINSVITATLGLIVIVLIISVTTLMLKNKKLSYTKQDRIKHLLSCILDRDYLEVNTVSALFYASPTTLQPLFNLVKSNKLCKILKVVSECEIPSNLLYNEFRKIERG